MSPMVVTSLTVGIMMTLVVALSVIIGLCKPEFCVFYGFMTRLYTHEISCLGNKLPPSWAGAEI
jgi:hypothetical protein